MTSKAEACDAPGNKKINKKTQSFSHVTACQAQSMFWECKIHHILTKKRGGIFFFFQETDSNISYKNWFSL